MTFNDLKKWPLQTTRVSCADGKFGSLVGFDSGIQAARVRVLGDFLGISRLIKARELEPGDHETLVQVQVEGAK